MSVVKLSDFEHLRNPSGKEQPPKESPQILRETRDLALHRLLLTVTSMLDKLGDELFEQAEKSTSRDETNMYLAARGVIAKERAQLVAAFDAILRRRVDDAMSGKKVNQQSYADLEGESLSLSLVDDNELEEKMATSNAARALESACGEEMAALNQRIGFLLGNEEIDSSANPLSPVAVVQSFAEAWTQLGVDDQVRVAILRLLNGTVFGDIRGVYADLNRHLIGRKVLPTLRPILRRDPSKAPRRPDGTIDEEALAAAEAAGGDGVVGDDVFATLQRLLGGRSGGAPAAGAAMPAGAAGMPDLGALMGGAGVGDAAAAGMAPLLIAPAVLSALTDLQRAAGALMMPIGEGGMPAVGGEYATELQAVSFAAAGEKNILREISATPFAQRLDQVDTMVLEIVAMMFDYIFDDKHIPDGIKALIGRLQIPVLKAAMLDKQFFSQKAHPARQFVNQLAEAALGWQGKGDAEDPLYKKIEEVVQRVQSDFTDNVEIFVELAKEFTEFMEAETAIVRQREDAATVEAQREDEERERAEVARITAIAEIEQRLDGYDGPEFVANFLRDRYSLFATEVFRRSGAESVAWREAMVTVEQFIWSIKPKRTTEERRQLTSLLPALLKRLRVATNGIEWPQADRDAFFSHLVDAHAAAVKASFIPAPPPAPEAPAAAAAAPVTPAGMVAGMPLAAPVPSATEQTVEQSLEANLDFTQPAQAPAGAAKPRYKSKPTGRKFALDSVALELETDPIKRQLASLERGTWLEFEDEKGTLSFSKLTWVSPHKGTFLFTNRNGEKAMTLTGEAMYELFKRDRARLADVEPLTDRAINSVVESLQHADAT